MKDIKNAVHFDFHTMPNIYNFGEDFNADVLAKQLHDSGVEYINFPAQCNVGFCYFDTKSGVKYPYMKGDRFKSILDACHSYGIGVSAYINLGFCCEQALKHTEWCVKDKEGKRIRPDGFRSMCYNTGYRDYVWTIIEEICRYDIDGLFCDCLQIVPCYCDDCKRKMLEKGMDIENTEQVIEFQYESRLEVCSKIKQILGNDKNLFFNGMPIQNGLNTHFELEWLPPVWGYDAVPIQAALGRSLYNRRLYMSGRFQADWGDFGGIKEKASIENDLYDAIMNGYALCVGDHLHPARNAEPKVMENVKAVNSYYNACLPYISNTEYKAKIAVLMKKALPFPWWDKHYVGVTRMLSELKMPFDIKYLDGDYKNYELVILPDVLTLNDGQADKLSKYIKNGGKVLSTGNSGLKENKKEFALSEYDFINLNDEKISEAGYFEFTGKDDKTQWATYLDGVGITLNNGKEFAKYIKPYFEKGFDGTYNYFYTPPEKQTGQTVAALHKSVAHVAFKVFTSYADMCLKKHKELVKDIIDEMIKPLIKEEGLPSWSRVSLLKGRDFDVLCIKATHPEIRGTKGIIEEHDFIPEGKTVFVDGEYAGAEVFDTKETIPLLKDGEFTQINLPNINGFEMIILRKEIKR